MRNLNLRGGRWPRPPLVSVDSFGSLCHLRWQQPTGLALPSVPSKVNSYRPAFPGRSIFAEDADRAHRSFRSLANIGVLRAGRAQPLYLLTPLGRFGPSAQVPTGHTLPSGAPSGRFAPFGPKCPGCSIIRASLTVARMVSLPRFGSLCHPRWQQPTGLALPFAPQGTRFPPVPVGRGVCASGANIS